jgi:hypothetical protein
MVPNRIVFGCGAASLALVVVLTGCSNDSTEVGTRDAASSASALGSDEPLVGCGSFAYPPSAFDGPLGAELADDDAAEALRGLIDDPDGIEGIPKSEWRRLYDKDDIVVFGSGEPLNDGTEQGLVEVALKEDGDGFAFYQSEYGCTPLAQVPDRSVVKFVIAEGEGPGPESTALEVLVTEMQCTSGAPVDDRLGQPLVRYGPTTIEVLLTATPLEGESFNCIGNPPSPTTLHLDEPIGERRVLDLSSYPPRDATKSGRAGSAG